MSLYSTPAWPAYALDPPPLNESYQLTFPDLIVRTDFEQGEARQRQAFRNGPTQFAVTWPMTPAEFEFFKGWYKKFAEGGGWFTIDVFDGDDYRSRTVRFVKGTLKTARSGGEWMVSVTYETADVITKSETDTALIALGWGTDMDPVDIAHLFHVAVKQISGDAEALII